MAKCGPDEQERIMKEQWGDEDSIDKDVAVWTLTIPWTSHNKNDDLLEKIQKVEDMSAFLWDLREGLRNLLKYGQHHSIRLYTDEKQSEQRPASEVLEDLQSWILEELDDRRIRFDS